MLIEISADHPALAGHFPGRPIIPGVVLLDEVAYAFVARAGAAPSSTGRGAIRITGFSGVKFIAPLAPQQACVVTFMDKKPGQSAFAVSRQEQTIVTGNVSYEYF